MPPFYQHRLLPHLKQPRVQSKEREREGLHPFPLSNNDQCFLFLGGLHAVMSVQFMQIPQVFFLPNPPSHMVTLLDKFQVLTGTLNVLAFFPIAWCHPT